MTETTRKYPFKHMRIADYSILNRIEGRHTCPDCNRSRKFFCYSCVVPVGELENALPQVTIPVHIDIIKHKKEIDGKSTAVHAALLSRHKVRIYTYPDIPDYSVEENVVLIFPGASSVSVAQLFDPKVRLKAQVALPKGHNMGSLMRNRFDEIIVEENSTDCKVTDMPKRYCVGNLPVSRAVFIDSTWNQSRGIYKDPRLRNLRTVVLQNRISQFWRHQRGSPRWYCATVEAVHQFLLELHAHAWGLNPHYRGLDNLELAPAFFESVRFVEAPAELLNCDSPYNGQYDNLMWFFANMYDLIHKYYDHNQLKSYRRPI